MINPHCISLSSALYDLFPEFKEKIANKFILTDHD